MKTQPKPEIPAKALERLNRENREYRQILDAVMISTLVVCESIGGLESDCKQLLTELGENVRKRLEKIDHARGGKVRRDRL